MSDECLYYTKARAIETRLAVRIPADSDESTNRYSAACSHYVRGVDFEGA